MDLHWRGLKRGKPLLKLAQALSVIQVQAREGGSEQVKVLDMNSSPGKLLPYPLPSLHFSLRLCPCSVAFYCLKRSTIRISWQAIVDSDPALSHFDGLIWLPCGAAKHLASIANVNNESRNQGEGGEHGARGGGADKGSGIKGSAVTFEQWRINFLKSQHLTADM